MSTSFSPPVQAALDMVDEASYTSEPDGTRIPQTSAPAIIATMLDLLDVDPGQRVLEIGTGSGYSTALLSRLVGDTGRVTSVEVIPDLTARAAELLRAHGSRNVELICGDGVKGAPGAVARFDRVIAWATVERIPDEWIRQITPEAVIVTPVNVTGLAKTFAIVRVGRDSENLEPQRLISGGFVEAHDQAVHQWLIPPYGADALTHDDQDRPWWLSATWLRTEGTAATASGEALLDRLIADARTVPGPLAETENPEGFYGYLLATRPAGLTTAALGDPAWRIGYTSPTGAALTSPSDAQHTIHAGDQEALHALTAWAENWRVLGRPGFDRLRPDLQRGEDGSLVRLTL
ncbi:methyltransferase domain-containing protein [Sphaerisporangium sp. NPDC051017]|uniref:protein-L-isoaspartate O-methyltransferase family protein n=1 Tax=Sphaerisporangium sp. NPDC051017 TaxID=3154636 RepID=UPI0034181F26